MKSNYIRKHGPAIRLNQNKKSYKNMKGTALFLVVAMIAILTPIILHFNTTTLERLRIANTISSKTRAYSLAEGGILLALETLKKDNRTFFIMPSDVPLKQEELFESSDLGKELLWIDESAKTPKTFGNGTISILITDESSKIDLNTSNVNLIRGGIQSAGIMISTTSEIFREEKERDMSREMAAAIIDWQDWDETPHPSIGAESSWYSRQNPPINSKNYLIETFGELSLVRYFSGNVAKLNLEKNFTLWGSTNGRINVNTASLNTIKAIPGIYESAITGDVIAEFLNNRPYRTTSEVRSIIQSFSSSVWKDAGRYIAVTSKRFRISVKARVKNVDATITTIIEKRGTVLSTLFWKEH